jgi:hypothetical protein
MNLNWRPYTHSRVLVEVPEVFVQFDPARLEGWKAAQLPFEKSGRGDYSIYGRYAGLARQGRFLLPYPDAPAKRFAEFQTALLLGRGGYSCWGQVHLFENPRPLFKNGNAVAQGKGNAVRNTLRVRNDLHWPWRWPTEIQHTLAFQPRNPDIVAHHPKTEEWRFCEVKGPRDSCSNAHFSEQLNALAVLHLLTGAPIAIVRPIANGLFTPRPRTYEAKIKYKRGARLDWFVGGDLP